MATLKTIVLLEGTTEWIVPPDWNNNNNKIEIIAGGGGGGGSTIPSSTSRPDGAGGAGGAYTLRHNVHLTPGQVIPVIIGAGGVPNFSGNYDCYMRTRFGHAHAPRCLSAWPGVGH